MICPFFNKCFSYEGDFENLIIPADANKAMSIYEKKSYNKFCYENITLTDLNNDTPTDIQLYRLWNSLTPQQKKLWY
jgi:hypothetical protein